MEKINDGGPAFPADPHAVAGMSLRDYFAAKAMQAMLTPEESFPQKDDDKAWYAKHAYAMADAMLRARE